MSDTATQLRDYIIPLADRSDLEITSKIRDTGGVEVLLARVFDHQVSQFNPEVAGVARPPLQL